MRLNPRPWLSGLLAILIVVPALGQEPPLTLPPASLPPATPAPVSLPPASLPPATLPPASVPPATLRPTRSITAYEFSLFDIVDLPRILDRTEPPLAPTADELIALAPFITSSDEQCRSIELCGHIQQSDNARLYFRACYRAPDQYSLILTDGEDGPPLALVADHQGLIYDPVRPMVLHSARVRFKFQVRAAEKCVAVGWKIWWKSTDPSTIEIDLRSVYERLPERATKRVSRTGQPRQFTLVSSVEDEWCARSVVDLEKPPFFTTFEVFPKRAKSPALSIDKIMVNGPVRDREFAFPAKAALANRMTVRDCTNDGLLGTLGVLGVIVRAAYVRAAAHNAEFRQLLKFPRLVGIDWEQVQKNDREYAPLLREALSGK